MAVNGAVNPALLRLQKNMEKTVSKTNTQATVNLPISALDWNPDNEYIFGMNGIEQLSEIIKGKFKGAIVVFDLGEINGVHRYEIGSGHRRVEALKIAGENTVPAIVLPMPNSIEKAEFLIDSNLQSRPLTPINYARAFAYIKKVYDAENERLKAEKKRPENVLEKIAKRYGMSRMNVSRYLSLNNLTPGLQKLISENVVSWTGLYPVTSWAEGEQNKLLQLIDAELKEISSDYAEEEEKVIKMTTPMLKALIAQIEGSKIVSEFTEIECAENNHKVEKKLNYNAYLAKLSSQIMKVVDLPFEEIDCPEDTSEIKDVIQSIREALDRLDDKINERKKS